MEEFYFSLQFKWNKISRIVFFTLLFTLNNFFIQAQDYEIDNVSVVSTCSGNFYDSGGTGTGYLNNENHNATFTANNGGQVVVNFTAINIEFEATCSYDALRVYDGVNASGTLLGTFCGNTLPPVMTSTTGSLHFVFTSDVSITRAGWRATLSCTTPPINSCTNGAIVGTPTANDPDGDGINNECDLDDDNDGITDEEEYCTNATTALFPSINATGDRQVTINHVDTGFAKLDLTELDNSFQMTVNGISVHPSILEFENGALGGGEVYFRFQSDNAFISSPWNPNVNGLPRVRLIIDESGAITLLGSRTTTSTTLEPMVAQSGVPFNTITWTPGANNTFIIINQVGPGPEELRGTLLASNICDTDGDGISNELDLDSDNDGIYDIVEAGVLNEAGVSDTNNDGVVDGADTGSGNNGLFNSVETNDTFGASLDYTVIDSDSDGFTDPYELDADNDSCNDVIEAGFTDANGDGILGNLPVIVNTSTGVVTGTGVTDGYTTPDDDDSNTVFDFQQVNNLTITAQPPNRSLCNGNTTFTIGASGTGLSYQWQFRASSTGTFTNLSNNATYSGVNTATLGVNNTNSTMNGYEYRVVVSSSAYKCSNVTSNEGVLTITEPSSASAGADQTNCNSSDFTMAANIPTTGTGAWSIISGSAAITNINLATTTVTGVAAGSSVTLRWTISNGSCTVTTDDVVLTNSTLPTAPIVGPDLCAPINIPAVCTYDTSIPSGGLTISSGESLCINSNFNHLGNITVANGATIYVSNGAQFNVNGAILLNGGEIILADDSSIAINGSISFNSGGVINAYSTLQTSNENITSINNSSQPTCNSAGDYCPISSFFGSIAGTPDINIFPCKKTGDISECAESPIQTLEAVAIPPFGSNVVWYDASSGGNVVATPTLNSVGTVTYYAESLSGAGCVSSSRTPVVLRIDPLPLADAPSNVEACDTYTLPALTNGA
ncbi:CUB domain-containing protein, partial [Tenacibaculum sp. 190524A02b]|uniref:CUB domain-containing protein n=1 Tax=Tenacibaculum vairaonense TaxID=3137860 RepID=UPI0032B1FEA4